MFSQILSAFVARLATEPELRPQVVMRPLPGPVPYDAKTGVHVFVGAPEPKGKACGAGRGAYQVRRRVSVLCVTESLNDMGGRSESAVAKQLNLENKVCNAGMDFLKDPIALGTAYQCMWVAGGDEMMRYVKLNPGLCGSVLVFEIDYVETLGSLVKAAAG